MNQLLSRRHLAAVILTGGLVILGSACGDGDNGDDDDVSPTSTFAVAENGPTLLVDEATVAAAINCPDGETAASGELVLLVHGGGSTPNESFAGSLLPELKMEGLTTCTVELPGRALGDIQSSAEYVVVAVRLLSRSAGGPIDVVGHSLGTIVARWAMMFWGDLPVLVDDYVSLAGLHQGLPIADALCGAGCVASSQQARPASMFIAALNAGDTTPGDASYTSLYSETDVLVPPPGGALSGAVNIKIQDLCPGRAVSHEGMLVDAAVFLVLADALTSDGAADIGRFPPDGCAGTVAPGGDAQSVADAMAATTAAVLGGEKVQTEPPIKPYATP